MFAQYRLGPLKCQMTVELIVLSDMVKRPVAARPTPYAGSPIDLYLISPPIIAENELLRKSPLLDVSRVEPGAERVLLG